MINKTVTRYYTKMDTNYNTNYVSIVGHTLTNSDEVSKF